MKPDRSLPPTTPPAATPTPAAHQPRPASCERCGAPLMSGAPCAACILQGAQAGAPSRIRSDGSGSAAFEAPSVEAVNGALPQYEVQVLIGQGGMGAVYRARHRKLDRLVAIKVLRPLELSDPALAADFTERFEREARVLAKLDHPHIVRIYDFGRADSPEAFFYLVLEYVDGASLRELMVEGRLSPKEVLELIPQVCEALQTAHGLGVIHRDIKPENILVDSEGRVRIADFGLAKLRGLEPEGMGLTQSHQTFGSVHYMAPEQLRSAGQVDHRADLYSLGVIVYEMLTGELPLGRFAAPSNKAGTHKGLDDIVFRALESEPAERYQGASELKEDLVAGESSQGPEPSNSAPKADRPGARGKGPRGESRKALVEDAKSERLEKDMVRTWVVMGILTLTYSLTWVEISGAHIVEATIGDSFAASLPSLSSSTVKASGNEMSALGIPLWVGLLGIFAAAILRTARSGGRPVDARLPIALGAVGTALILSSLVAVASQGLGSGLREGFVIALLTYFSNSIMDLNSIVDFRAYRRIQGRQSRL